ncbi:hypothetical protein SDJN02_14828, partial [Cucurbita argyrosperma subsp. argyrosperma]
MVDFTAVAELLSQSDYEINLQSQSERGGRRKKKEELNRPRRFGRKRLSLFLLCFSPTPPFPLCFFKLSARRSMACRRRIVGNIDPVRKRSGGLRTKQAGRGSCRGS